MSSVIFSLTRLQARALIELYDGRADATLWTHALRAELIEHGLGEPSGDGLTLTPIGYHAAQLARAIHARARHEQAMLACLAELHAAQLAAAQPQLPLPLAA